MHILLNYFFMTILVPCLCSSFHYPYTIDVQLKLIIIKLTVNLTIFTQAISFSYHIYLSYLPALHTIKFYVYLM